MSLYDALKNPDPATAQGLLQMGLSLLASKGSLANALGTSGMAGIQGAQQYKDRIAAQKRAGLMDQLTQGQLGQMRRNEEMQALPGQFYKPPSMPGVDATGGMETAMENPANAANPQGAFDMGGYTNALMGMNPQAAIQLQALMQKQAPEVKTFKPGDVAGTFEGGKFNQILSVPDKPSADSVSPIGRLMAEMNALPPNDPRRADYMAAIKKATTHQPGTSVSVNTGQKGFDNTLKLRGDFRGEPIYKAHQEVQAAHSQIKQALSLASPAGDLAGATKIMKILDPGSVVRESELGMAMAASGLMDRVQNYAQNIMKGTKLTPDQRADFNKLADALFSESVKQYNAKRSEYAGISDRNQLNTVDVVGPEAKPPGDGWSITPVR